MREGKTFAEAEKILAKQFPSISHICYYGMDVAFANMLNAQLNRFIEMFPNLLSKIKAVGSTEGLVYKAKNRGAKLVAVSIMTTEIIAIGAYTEYGSDRGWSGIAFSSEYVTDMKKLKRNCFFNWKFKHLSTWTVEGLIVHEISHAIHRTLSKRSKAELTKFYESLTQKDIEKDLSRYGASCTAEFVAEALAEFYTAKYPRALAKRVGEIVEQERKAKLQKSQ